MAGDGLRPLGAASARRLSAGSPRGLRAASWTPFRAAADVRRRHLLAGGRLPGQLADRAGERLGQGAVVAVDLRGLGVLGRDLDVDLVDDVANSGDFAAVLVTGIEPFMTFFSTWFLSWSRYFTHLIAASCLSLDSNKITFSPAICDMTASFSGGLADRIGS